MILRQDVKILKDQMKKLSCNTLLMEDLLRLQFLKDGILIIQKATHGIHGMQLMNLYPLVQEQVPLFLDGINLIMMVTYGITGGSMTLW